jgi:hypothetical protein
MIQPGRVVVGVADAFPETNHSGTVALARVPVAITASLFPNSVPDCSFPYLPSGDGKTGTIALNEGLLPGSRIAKLSVRVLECLPTCNFPLCERRLLTRAAVRLHIRKRLGLVGIGRRREDPETAVSSSLHASHLRPLVNLRGGDDRGCSPLTSLVGRG